MNRIVVSPKACGVAAHLITQVDTDRTVKFRDADVASELRIAVDTVYRAVVELDQLGAIDNAGMDRITGVRTATVDTAHWVFVAVAQTGPEVSA